MTGFTPDEGELLVVQMITKQDNVDRGSNLDLVLFTNVGVDDTITAATLTEPVGTGYAAITLLDINWTLAGSQSAYPLQTFSAGVGGWAGTVYGYAILTKGTTPRILTIEIDPLGPYIFNEADAYDVTPILTGA